MGKRACGLLSVITTALAACAVAPPDNAEIQADYREYFAAHKAANSQPLPPPEQRSRLLEPGLKAARDLQRSDRTEVRFSGFALESQTDRELGRNAEGLAVIDRFDPSALPQGLQAEYAYVRGCVGFPIAPEQAGRDLDRAVELAPNEELRRHFEQMRRHCRHEPPRADDPTTGAVKLTP